MSLYIGNTETTIFLGTERMSDISVKPWQGPVEYWNVRKCGTTSPVTQLAIYADGFELLAGYAVRPTDVYGNRLPGYDVGCWELISSASTGIDCSIKAPSLNCSQSACIETTCTTYQVTNSSLSLGGQVSYIPCGKTGYRSQFVGIGQTINLCVENDQIVNVSGFASSSLTDTNTACTASLVDCISYTIANSAGVTRDYSGQDCSNCATSLYNINAGASVVRCFVSGTFATDYPANVTATAGATCNVSGSGCQIPL